MGTKAGKAMVADQRFEPAAQINTVLSHEAILPDETAASTAETSEGETADLSAARWVACSVSTLATSTGV